MTSITNSGLAIQLVNALQQQQITIAKLSQQVSTNVQNVDLTDYTPPEAHNLLNFQNSILQRQSYIASLGTVNSRLGVYDSTLTDIEKIAGQASTLATANQTYNAATISGVASQVDAYLQSITNDLNQQVDGRYIYSGSRYTTPPVSNLTTVAGAASATATTNPALPVYDTNYTNTNDLQINSAPSGNFTFGNVVIPWAQLEGVVTSPINLNYTVNGVAQTPISLVVTTGASTQTSLAANLAAAFNAVQGAQPANPIAGVTATANGSGAGDLSLSSAGTPPQIITPNAGGAANQTTWSGGVDGALAKNNLASSYTKDTATVDTNFNITYGITSNDPSMQKFINGLLFMKQAIAAGQGGDTATYQADMQQASTLIANGLIGIQALHAGIANNQNIVKTGLTQQNTDVTTLQNQISAIQGIDLTKIGSELNLLQTQLQASYSSTASLEKLSLLNYL